MEVRDHPTSGVGVMYRTILVPLDGSPFGEHALPLALALARRTGATLHLVHVHSPLAAVYLEGVGFLDESLDQHLRREEEAYLSGVVQRLARVSTAQVATALVDGAVAGTLSDHAVRTQADLVVMTTHGRGALGRFWLGSVADELVRHLPMPVLLTRPEDGQADLSREPPLDHLLLALDGTPIAEKMVEPTLELAATLGAEVTLVRAVQPVVPLTYHPEGLLLEKPAPSLVERIDAMQQELRKEASVYLEGVAERFRARGVKVRWSVAVDKHPAAAILHEADLRQVKLIAVETHGRSGLKRLILGSVADKVIRGAHVPVLVHRPFHP
jgi:nucleotide-binding universal stress UspA family protein